MSPLALHLRWPQTQTSPVSACQNHFRRYLRKFWHTEILCHTLFSLNNMLKCQLNSLSCAANQCLQGLQLYIQVSMTRKKNISKTWKANGSQNTPVSRQPTVDDMDSKFKSNFDFKDLKVVLWMHTRRASMVLKWSGSIESTMAIKCYQTTSWKH